MSSRSTAVVCLAVAGSALLQIGSAHAEPWNVRNRVPAAHAAVPVERVMPPPMGLLDFCERDPVTCAGPSGNVEQFMKSLGRARGQAWQAILLGNGTGAQPGSIGQSRARRAASPESGGRQFLGGLGVSGMQPPDGELAMAEAINATLNRAIVAVSDQRLYGQVDRWTLPQMRDGGRLAGDCEDYVLAKRESLLRAGFAASRVSIALARTPEGEDHAVLLLAFPDGDYVLDNRDSRVLHWSMVRLDWQARQRPGDLLQWIGL